HQPLPFELLDEDRDRRLRQALELRELGDPPRTAVEGLQKTDLGARELSSELSDEQPGKQRRLRKQLGRDVIDLPGAGGHRWVHIDKLYYFAMLVKYIDRREASCSTASWSRSTARRTPSRR